jgi:hypothetical protein
MSNKLLMHYGCKTVTGQFMQTSYSLLFVKLGLMFQPLQESHDCFNFLATHSWMKMLWEKLSKFDMKVVVVDFKMVYPCEDNWFIMQVLIKLGYPKEMLLRLNRVQVSLQLLFMPDILSVSGNKITNKILSHCPKKEKHD